MLFLNKWWNRTASATTALGYKTSDLSIDLSINITTRFSVPVRGVGVQVLDDIFGYRASGDGLSLSQVDQVRGDLSSMIGRRLPAQPQAGGRRVEERRGLFAFVVLLLLIVSSLRDFALHYHLWIPEGVDAADRRWHWAGRLTEHGIAEGPHAGYIYRLKPKHTDGVWSVILKLLSEPLWQLC